VERRRMTTARRKRRFLSWCCRKGSLIMIDRYHWSDGTTSLWVSSRKARTAD
jgi:hypothetical protein